MKIEADLNKSMVLASVSGEAVGHYIVLTVIVLYKLQRILKTVRTISASIPTGGLGRFSISDPVSEQ